MKSKLILFVLAISLMSCGETTKTQLESLEDFSIHIEKTETGISMQSSKGSAWNDLSFTLDNNQPQAIDEYGMADLDNDNLVAANNLNLTDYLFTVSKTDEGILLKGIKGTTWKELSFTLGDYKKQAIDQFGMADIN